MIQHKAKQLEGFEYCQFRRYNTLNDLDGDGKEDFIVLFTVEGIHHSMNNTYQFIYVFLSGNPNAEPLQIQVGSRGKQETNEILISSDEILLPMSVWGKDDGICCPSQTDTTTLRILQGKLEIVPRKK